MITLHERYVNFYTDFAFKKLFGTEVNKDLLISFLNALLQGKELIKDLKYINTENLGTQEYDRKAVFDVYCETEDGRRILVEMQKAEQQFFKDRSIFYSTFPIRDQAVKGHISIWKCPNFTRQKNNWKRCSISGCTPSNICLA